MRADSVPEMAKALSYRPDIDGLRAVAVLSVVLFHAFPTLLPGGFVGVDIFFVISGFLITRIIVADHGRGQFSLSSFYGRRIRRIFPALILLLLCCLIVGWQALLANEYAQLGLHMTAGAGFVSNLALWRESGYFDTASELKPLLHLWSLGIEEQFYIAWPLIIWLTYKKTFRGVWVTLVLLLASFAWNVFTVGHDAVAAFYAPYARAWELWVGAGLAYLHGQPNERCWRLLQHHANSLAALGVLLIGVAMGVLSKQSLFPGGWAVLPTLGAALLIATPASWFNKTVLSHGCLVLIGLISYPLYLWHWPLLSFGRIVENGELSAQWRVGLVLVAILLSATTYFFVERFLRHRGWVVTGLLMITMLVLGLLGWNIYSRDGLEFRYRKIMELPAQMKRDFTKWEDKAMYPEGDCVPQFAFPNAHICLQSRENEQPSTIVFGDSHAFHGYWGIAKSFADDRHVVKLVGRGGCNFGMYLDNEDCIRSFETQVEWMTTNSAVKHVFIVHRLVVKSDNPQRDKLDYQRRMESVLSRLILAERQVIYILPIPELRFNPRLCISKLPFGRKVDASHCDFSLERELAYHSVERELVAQWRRQFPSLEIFDPADVLCPQNRCQAVRDHQALWMDDNHVTETGSYLLGEAMAKTIRLK